MGEMDMDILRYTNKLFKSKQTFYHMLWPSWFSETYKVNWYFCNDCFSLMVGEPDIYLFTQCDKLCSRNFATLELSPFCLVQLYNETALVSGF